MNHRKIKKEDFYTNIRYVFLFNKKVDSFLYEQYKFLGFYKLISYDEKNKIRIWEKQDLIDGIMILNEDEIIKLIKNIENS